MNLFFMYVRMQEEVKDLLSDWRSINLFQCTTAEELLASWTTHLRQTESAALRLVEQ